MSNDTIGAIGQFLIWLPFIVFVSRLAFDRRKEWRAWLPGAGIVVFLLGCFFGGAYLILLSKGAL